MKIYENQIQYRVSEKAPFFFTSPVAIFRYRDRWRILANSGVTRNFVRGGGQQIQLRTEDREKGDLGAVDP